MNVSNIHIRGLLLFLSTPATTIACGVL